MKINYQEKKLIKDPYFFDRMNLFQELPSDIKTKIYEYDPTYRDRFNRVVQEIKDKKRYMIIKLTIMEDIIAIRELYEMSMFDNDINFDEYTNNPDELYYHNYWKFLYDDDTEEMFCHSWGQEY